MKKLIVIICILSAIFIGMYINQRNQIAAKKVTTEEVEKIEQYITQIYMWKEVTEEALPTFKEINQAPEKWIWEAVKKNIEKYEDIKISDIQEKAKELFGPNFTKQFPEQGNTSFEYQESEKIYNATDIKLDTENDKFLINKIEKTKQGYEVEIVEYLEDYSEEPDDSSTQDSENEAEFNIPIKTINGDQIFVVKNTEGQTKIIEQVKENADKFSKKKLAIEKDSNENLYITKVE